jgi:hypothetical protein
VDLVFTGRVVEWRGPSPYHFVRVPAEECADIQEVAAAATYGWGVVPVSARVGEIAFDTSLFPQDGGYLLPLKDAVRKPQGLAVGDDVTVRMTVRLQSRAVGRRCPVRSPGPSGCTRQPSPTEGATTRTWRRWTPAAARPMRRRRGDPLHPP